MTGYDVEASTMAGFTAGTVASTVTTNTSALTLTFNNGQLVPNTTYFVRIGALYNGATTYINTIPSSTSTLTSLISAAQVYAINSTSITVNWTAMTVGTGTNTSEGYRLEASTASDFSGTIYFSSNSTPATSTLTVTGLTTNVAYYLRAGALNWNNVPNFVTPTGSPATTIAGSAPTNPLITAVYVSSLTSTWGAVSSPSGYSLEASTMSNFTGTIISSVTTDGTVSTLTFNVVSLAANTTYFVRVGALYNGATSYALTMPQSTSTLTSPITTEQYYQVNGTSVTVNWVAFGTGSGNNTSEGYELDASTASDFTGNLFFSSNTTPATSTLTVTGLSAYTTYYFRSGGAVNYNNVVNYTIMSATRTIAGSPVTNPLITAVFVSSLTA